MEVALELGHPRPAVFERHAQVVQPALAKGQLKHGHGQPKGCRGRGLTVQANPRRENQPPRSERPQPQPVKSKQREEDGEGEWERVRGWGSGVTKVRGGCCNSCAGVRVSVATAMARNGLKS